MRELATKAMLDGASGLSTGLFCVLGIFSPHEVIEIARVAAQFGGMHISHMRSESDETCVTALDKSTFDELHRYAEGFAAVLVNGVPVLTEARMTGDLPGRVLRRKAFRINQ